MYKDEYNADLWKAKPHLFIPLDLIDKVQKVKLLINNDRIKTREKDWEDYQYKFVLNIDLQELGIQIKPLKRLTSNHKNTKKKNKLNEISYAESQEAFYTIGRNKMERGSTLK